MGLQDAFFSLRVLMSSSAIKTNTAVVIFSHGQLLSFIAVELAFAGT
jgi:hypothetical protein